MAMDFLSDKAKSGAKKAKRRAGEKVRCSTDRELGVLSSIIDTYQILKMGKCRLRFVVFIFI